ncbi:MAG TPA: hypothetical protein VF458_12230 [Ktedonobacteraceae bacterium]
MPKPSNALVRSYALEMLADVKEHPHMNKEQLFTDAMAFYRWRLTEKEEAEEALELYMHEFRMLHKQVVSKLSLEVWGACFITWFVEKGFHKLPPLTGYDPTDQMMLNTRFSSPSFRLPTGEPTETFLIQWVLWHLDNPPAPAELLPGKSLVYRWSRELLESLPTDEFRMSDALLNRVMRFFFWAREHLRTWAAFTEHQTAFLYSQPGRCDVLADPCVDLLFIHWFVKTVLDQHKQDQQQHKH